MTTICSDGITIAGDGLACWGDEPVSRADLKIEQRGNRIFALSGASAMLPALIKWVDEGADVARVPAGIGPEVMWSLLVIEKTGVCAYVSKCPYASPMSYPISIGSGADYAMGAMHAGKTPREAVEIASKLDVWTGGDIQVIDIAEALGLAPHLQAAE